MLAVTGAGLLLAACQAAPPSNEAKKASPTPPLHGSAGVTDPVGDLKDVEGKLAARPQLAVDLREVRLRADGSVLTIRFVGAGPIPADSGPGEYSDGRDRLFWAVDMWRVGQEDRLYHVEVFLVGRRWEVQLISFVPPDSKVLPVTPVIEREAVTVAVPLKEMPKLNAPFEWTAVSHWMFRASASGNVPLLVAGGDDVPNEGRASFPG